MVHGTEMQKRCLRSTSSPAAGRAPCACPSRRPVVAVRRRDPRSARWRDFESDPLGPRYRLKGNKMWISAGEHELTENIVHLVLAKIPDRTAS
jgi:butyryl-CoA dehydrogenase